MSWLLSADDVARCFSKAIPWASRDALILREQGTEGGQACDNDSNILFDRIPHVRPGSVGLFRQLADKRDPENGKQHGDDHKREDTR